MKEYRNYTIEKVVTDFAEQLFNMGVTQWVAKRDRHQTIIEITIPDIIINDIEQEEVNNESKTRR